MKRILTFVLCMCLGPAAIADIEIVTIEFKPEQREEVIRIVEAVESLCAEAFDTDFSTFDDGARLELHMQYRDYERVDRELNNGEFRRAWTFTNPRVMQSHIALQPPVEPTVLYESGLPLQTKVQIAEEAVSLCMYRALANKADQPDWLDGGLIGRLACDAIRASGDMGPIEDEPWSAREIILVERLFEDMPDYNLDTLFEDVEKDINASRLNAVRSAFVGWLREIGAFETVMRESRGIGSSEDRNDKYRALTLGAIGDAGVENPDQAFKDWVLAFEPKWNQVYRSLETNGDAWFHCAFDSTNSVCWNSQKLGRGNWELSGSLRIFEGDKSQMNVLLGKSDTGYLSVALGPTFGVTVFHRQYQDNDKSKWVRLIHEDMKTFELEDWVDFKISKRRDRLMIKINRERPVVLDVKDIDLTGEWGLGCQNNSAGLWKGVVFED